MIQYLKDEYHVTVIGKQDVQIDGVETMGLFVEIVGELIVG